MTQRVLLSQDDIDRLRYLVEVEKLQHRKIADILGWPRCRLGRRIRELGLKTQRTGPRNGVEHPCWKGGRKIDKNGYVLVWVLDHPSICRTGHKSGGYVREHRLVMEKVLGRTLLRSEVVDHINSDTSDNRPENLRLFQTNGDHLHETRAGKCPKWTAKGVRAIAKGKGWTPASIDRLSSKEGAAASMK